MPNVLSEHGIMYLMAAALFLVLVLGTYRWAPLARINRGIDGGLKAWTATLDSLPVSALSGAIVLASGAALFLELSLIRLHAEYVPLFALLKNVSLLSCFLGLGAGYMYTRHGRTQLLPLQPVLLLAQLCLLRALAASDDFSKLGSPFGSEFETGVSAAQGASQLVGLFVVLLIFTVNALTFLPLGQVIGRLMERIETGRAYRYNLIGSILGVALFSLLSHVWLGGSMWIATYGILIAPCFLAFTRTTAVSLLTLLASAYLVDYSSVVTKRQIYSPYQTLSVTTARDSDPIISANTFYFQRILNLSDTALSSVPALEKVRRYYELPYDLLPRGGSVLVVGSGAGNDVAAALRRGAGAVAAVEIDPAIAELGASFHPEDPYHSTRVTRVISDARAFLKRTTERYDAVVYGLLDSHALLSGQVSGLRLDSYVYTVEALREARAALKPGGFISLSFVYLSPEFGRKLFLMLTEAFDGLEPVVFHTSYDGAVTFFAGRPVTRADLPSIGDFQELTQSLANNDLEADVSTDDWPYLYMPRRTYPLSYFVLWIPLLLISAIFVAPAFRREGLVLDGVSFSLGAAFMLLETKAFTEIALVWGATFSVTVTVIFAILALAVVANEFVLRTSGQSPRTNFLLLLASVALGYLSTFANLSGLPWILEGGIRAILLTLPLFFAGICFSTQLKKDGSVNRVMASNLLGAMVGGILEYTSMITGFRALYFGVAALYLCAFYLMSRAKA